MHWVLDVTLVEDKNRKRKGNSAKNASLISKITLTLIEQHQDKKESRRGKRLKALIEYDECHPASFGFLNVGLPFN